MANDDSTPEFIDLESLDLGPLLEKARTATFAPNWKSVLLADAFVGMVMVALGVLASFWIAIIGWLIIAVGLVYIGLVGRRFLQWRWLRKKAGLG